MPIWVKLPNLPFELWYLAFFKLIGNTLGTFLEVDLSFLVSRVCCLGRVLVLLDLRKGLASDIDIKIGDNVFNQSLDYIGIPFKCNHCHSYGHLASQCLLTLKKKFHEEPKPNLVWRVKNLICSATLDEVRVDDVKPREVDLDFFDDGIVPTLKPLVILVQDMTVDNCDEASSYKNLGILSPSKPLLDTGFRSGTKFIGSSTSSGIGVGKDASGMRSVGFKSKDN